MSLSSTCTRLELLWKFVKLIPRSKELELECQAIQQKMHDLKFSNDLSPGAKETELARQEGKVEGIQYCLKKFSTLAILISLIGANVLAASFIQNPFTGRFDAIADSDQSAKPTNKAQGYMVTVSTGTSAGDIYFFSGGHRFYVAGLLDDPAPPAAPVTRGCTTGMSLGILLGITCP